MSTASSSSSQQQMLARALEALKEARQRLEQVERSRRESLAIVGMGCRFPGSAVTPEAFWQVISQGKDAISEVPRDRWPYEMFFGEDEAPGKMRFRHAGFLDNVDQFDAAFFGISPREAERMDPQQRLLLQVACEAIEDAGIEVESLAGSRTGVWIGVNSHDYLNLQLRDPDLIDTYTLVGGTSSIVANRLSYLLDLRGPSLAVDTACSTALVAVHLACQSLRAGECDVAIVGAVNLILSPFTTMAHVRGMPLAVDYHCKTFDARADGYVRGEGCGVLVLRRLSDAQRRGDAIWAQIRGSAVNQDGRTNGMTAPNGLSQQGVIRQALESGAVPANSVGYIEAHGTGTALGDPIEVEALQQVYGEQRTEPCTLGSVKPNIGHLESAAGMAGLMKVVLALHHRQLPGVRDFQQLNPHIDLDEQRFVIPRQMKAWNAAVRRGAVSSFGAGGTNAHVVLEERPEAASVEAAAPTQTAAQPAQLVVVSGRDEEGLRRNAEAWRGWLEHQGDAVAIEDVAYTSVHRRSWRDHRLVVRAQSSEELRRRLRGWLAGEQAEDVIAGRAASGHRRRLVFVCPGQGSQWVGMAQDLLEQPAFLQAIERCDVEIAKHTDWSLFERLRESKRPFDRIDVIQPTLWAVTVALAEQWKDWGVTPDAVIGHSMGEAAAAVISGALTLEDAAKVICRRSKLLVRAAGKGLMLLVGLGPEDAERYLAGLEARVSLAVCNSPGTAVLSGDPEAIGQIERQLLAANVFHRRIAVDVASHSPQMDPLASELRAMLADLSPRVPTIPMFSTVDLQLVSDARLNADYWVRNLRDPVRFGDVTAHLLAEGHDELVELSPHPILCTAIEQTIEKTSEKTIDKTPGLGPVPPLVLPSMQRERSGVETMQRALAALIAGGHEVDRTKLGATRGTVQRLPTYQWSQRSFWFCEDRWAPLRAAGGAAAGSPAQAALRAAAYRLEWAPRPAVGETTCQRRPWFLIGGDGETRQALVRAFEARGVFARPLDELPAATDERWSIEAPGTVLDLRAPGPDVAGIEAATAASATLLASLQLLRKVHGSAPRLWTVTRGAQDVAGTSPAAAVLWGLGRAAAIEHANGWGGLVDLPAQVPVAGMAEALVEALLADDGEDQLRLEADGQVRVARLVADVELPIAAEGFSPDEHASTLVIGPRGGAVQLVLRALHERGARGLIWLEEGAALSSAPATLELPPETLAISRAQLAGALAARAQEGRPVRKAIFLPAPPSPCALRDLDAAQLAGALQRSAGTLDELLLRFTTAPLDELVVLSSVAGSWGSMGMGHVGAAAAYLDAAIRRHRAAGRAYAVLESTPWAGGDMIDEAAAAEGERLGVEALPPETALAALLRASTCRPASRAVARIDWPRLRAAYEAQRPRPVLGELGRGNASAGAQPGAGAELLAELRELPAEARAPRLQAYLTALVATLLRYSADAVGPDTGFFQLGMDSILAMELRRRLSAAVALPVPASMVFEYPTVARLTRHVLERIGLLDPTPATAAAAEVALRADEARQMLADAAAMSEQELLDALAQELE